MSALYLSGINIEVTKTACGMGFKRSPLCGRKIVFSLKGKEVIGKRRETHKHQGFARYY